MKAFKLFLIVTILCAFLSGCAFLDKFFIGQDTDGDGVYETPSTAQQVGEGLQEGGTVAASAGLPYGWIATAVGGILTGLSGAYSTMRQKQKTIDAQDSLTGQQQLSAHTEAVLGAIVQAIENFDDVAVPTEDDGETSIGELLKEFIKEKLVSNGNYLYGKAIIAELKSVTESTDKLAGDA